MESKDAGEALAQARRAQARLAAGLRLPGRFFGTIGLAITAQLLATAVGVVVDSASARVVLLAGLLGFGAVAGIQVARFRRVNGARVSGLVNRVVLGTTTTASLVYAAALAGALWAGFAGHWWLAVVCSAAGGAGYVVSGMRWLRRYRADPQANAHTEPLWWTVVSATLAGAGLFLLIAGH